MLITILAPEIGYDKAAEIARSAQKNGTTIREEVLADGCLTAEQYDAVVIPENMIQPR